MRKLCCMLLAIAVMSASLAGCASNNRSEATHSPDVRPSATATLPNDAHQGGGAGGTNDTNNDGRPDAVPDASERVSDGVLDDIGNAAGDVIEGAGDVIQGAGDAVGDAARRAGNALEH